MLKKYQLDFSQSDLAARTAKLLRGYGLTDEGYQSLMNDLRGRKANAAVERIPSDRLHQLPYKEIQQPVEVQPEGDRHSGPSNTRGTTNAIPSDPLRELLRKQMQEQHE